MKIALFDMDGTLTEARQTISPEMVDALDALSYFCDIGIVTGSGLSYVKEQLNCWITGLSGACVRFFPCNGTQEWSYHGDDGFEQTYNVSMMEEIGEGKLRALCGFLLQQQLLCISDFPEMPVTGDFIINRGSMLNYCPPGRSCSTAQRKQFVDLDTQRGIRLGMYRRLNTYITYKDLGCVAALGGNTSIDIYPTGWDKTYVLRHFQNIEKISFVGDRCMEGGNDKSLYDVINTDQHGAALQVHTVKQTLDTIYNKLIPHFKE